MAFLQEFYTLTSDDEDLTMSIKKDFVGNIEIKLDDGTTLLVPEEFTTQFAYVINRIN